MTSQSIKNGMSKAEWTILERKRVVLESRKIITYVQGVNTSENENEYNALAITSAVNNTFGKGIDPECVEEMYEALITIIGERYTKHDIDKIQELLTSAKLK